MLNRTLRYVDGPDARIELEGDIRHSELIVDQLGSQKAKPVTTPAVRRSSSEVEEDKHSPKLSSSDTSLFRSVAMRAVYLAQDRQDIVEATKNLSREMKEPREASMRDLKRLGRYLKYRPRLVAVFRAQRTPETLHSYGDSDNAGCLKTRRSTTGVAVMLGSHLLKTYSGSVYDQLEQR